MLCVEQSDVEMAGSVVVVPKSHMDSGPQACRASTLPIKSVLPAPSLPAFVTGSGGEARERGLCYSQGMEILISRNRAYLQ